MAPYYYWGRDFTSNNIWNDVLVLSSANTTPCDFHFLIDKSLSLSLSLSLSQSALVDHSYMLLTDTFI